MYLHTGNNTLAGILHGVHILDGATGTQLISAGMPRSCCQEKWILDNPQTIIEIQRQYADAGSEIIYAPTFQANALALRRYNIDGELNTINSQLIALSRTAAPDCMIAGNVTTLRGYIDTSDEHNFSKMLSVYRSQIHAIACAGVDLLVGETLLHPLEAKAILTAAKDEGISCAMVSFALKTDGTLHSGHDAEYVLREAEHLGAAAIGINCIAANENLPLIINRLRQSVSIPLICKPNTGRPVNGARPIDISMFTDVMQRCIENGASLVGGCCGTTPEHIAALKKIIR